MKKLSIILIFALLLSLWTGCVQTPSSGDSSDAGNADSAQTQDGEILLYDFEDYERNFQLMRVCGYFGAVNVNLDKQYVKNGNISALLQPLGPHSTANAGNVLGVNPKTCLYIPFSSTKYKFDYTDGTKLEEVRFSIYNAETKPINLYVSLIMEKNAQKLSPAETFVLEPGWNEVFYTPDHSVIAINYDLQQCYGIALNSDNVHSRYLKDAPKLYMDDLYITLRKESVEVKNLIDLKENEICDFESDWQKYVLTSMVADDTDAPDLEIVTASDYGLVAPSGNKILRVTMKPTDIITSTVYNGFTFTQALIDAIGLENLSDDRCIAFDVYNASSVPLDFPTIFYNSKETTYKGYNTLVNPGEWTTSRISLKTLDELFGKGENTYRMYPSHMVIQWPEFKGEERVAYFDNFRIE